MLELYKLTVGFAIGACVGLSFPEHPILSGIAISGIVLNMFTGVLGD